jgi:Transposase IS116/IS110/IS902 family
MRGRLSRPRHLPLLQRWPSRRPDSTSSTIAIEERVSSGSSPEETLRRRRAVRDVTPTRSGSGEARPCSPARDSPSPGRPRSEPCFARLAGVAPVPASTGQTRRPRLLNRGGDRQLNRALQTIVLHRRQHDPATRDYIAKRVAEGKSRRAISVPPGKFAARCSYRRAPVSRDRLSAGASLTLRIGAVASPLRFVRRSMRSRSHHGHGTCVTGSCPMSTERKQDG